MMRPVYDARRVTMVCGVSGCGKTSYVIRFLLNAARVRQYVFDPDGDYAARLATPAASR